MHKLIESHCAVCHRGDTAEGELDLTPLLQNALNPAPRASVLEKIRKRVAAGEMPPEDSEPLRKSDRQHLLSWIGSSLDGLSEQLRDDPGLVVMPRLTPAEYRNVLRDLSGGVVQNAGRFLPIEGGAGEGFSNVGQAQGMNAAQFEKYLEAAKLSLRHLRVSPVHGLIWQEVPRDPVDTPEELRFELINDVIAWYGGQQVQWGNGHLRDLERTYGLSHGLYLEAAWRYRYRRARGEPNAAFADITRDFDAALSPLILAKWWDLLHQDDPSEHAAGVIQQWRSLPAPGSPQAKQIRQLCRAIESWKAPVEEDEQKDRTFAPPYELSFRDEKSRQKVKAAAKQGRFPFEIEIGPAVELFLVLTDFRDGSSDDYGCWHQGVFEFADGSTKPWEKLVTIKTLDGMPRKWGSHPKDEGRGPTSVGVHAPAVLKFKVPAGARKFRTEFVITDGNAKQSSVQALVLWEAPPEDRRRLYPKRYVFGGADSRRISKQGPSFKDFAREIRKRNIPSANLTKVGLNAERNVLSDWTLTDIEYLGGPWDHQPPDKPRPLIPYYFTAEEVRRVATPEALKELDALHERLAAVVQRPHQDLLAFLKAHGWQDAQEGLLPPEKLVASWSEEQRKQYAHLRERVAEQEQTFQQQASHLLCEFATRPWRRPLTGTEQAALVALYRDARLEGFNFDAAMKVPLLSVLVSPHFLYRHPSTPPQSAGQRELDDYELASRLSFFLWSSIPDQRLLDLAAAGKLRDRAVLQAEAARLLRDPRAAALAREFAGQLWRFSGFANYVGPDSKRFKQFTPELRQAMLDEVVYFLSDLFQHDRPLTNLIRADYTFVNEALADLYGLQGVKGDRMRRVSLEPGSPRGGLVGMGLFLTQTSLPLRTSPVQRGVWVMEDLLGREMPSPPADVDPISADETNDAGLTIREQLEMHRAKKSCASCHDKIDPLGIALENFDAIGRWRTADRSGAPLSTSARTHDGADLSDVAGLRNYLDEHRDELFEHFNRKLLGFALGRSVGPGDKALLEKMHAELKQEDYRFAALVRAIVNSPQFRTRNTTPSEEISK